MAADPQTIGQADQPGMVAIQSDEAVHRARHIVAPTRQHGALGQGDHRSHRPDSVPFGPEELCQGAVGGHVLRIEDDVLPLENDGLAPAAEPVEQDGAVVGRDGIRLQRPRGLKQRQGGGGLPALIVDQAHALEGFGHVGPVQERAELGLGLLQPAGGLERLSPLQSRLHARGRRGWIVGAADADLRLLLRIGVEPTLHALAQPRFLP